MQYESIIYNISLAGFEPVVTHGGAFDFSATLTDDELRFKGLHNNMNTSRGYRCT